MRFLRLFNPLYTIRLERDLAAMHKQREGDKRAIKSFVETIGRQAKPGSETELRGMIVLLDGRVHALEISTGLAMNYLRANRTDAALHVLAAILDSAPDDQREAG